MVSALERLHRLQSEVSLASTDSSGDDGAGPQPPRKRARILPPFGDMHQPGGAPNGVLQVNGAPAAAPAAASRNGDVCPRPPPDQMSQEIVRLMGQHLKASGYE